MLRTVNNLSEMDWNRFSSGSSTRALVSAVLGFITYGTWAYFVNVNHGGPAVGWRSGIVQGGYSFLLTLSSAYLMEFVYGRLQGTAIRMLAWILTLLLTMAVLFVTAFSINWAAGTPRILMTILPGFIIGSVYSLFYLLNLRRLLASH